MLRTGKQARKALKEIKRKTDWSLRKIAISLDMSHAAVADLYKGATKNPSDEFMKAIDDLAAEVDTF